jgi:hypothetical protein
MRAQIDVAADYISVSEEFRGKTVADDCDSWIATRSSCHVKSRPTSRRMRIVSKKPGPTLTKPVIARTGSAFSAGRPARNSLFRLQVHRMKSWRFPRQVSFLLHAQAADSKRLSSIFQDSLVAGREEISEDDRGDSPRLRYGAHSGYVRTERRSKAE